MGNVKSSNENENNIENEQPRPISQHQQTIIEELVNNELSKLQEPGSGIDLHDKSIAHGNNESANNQNDYVEYPEVIK